ncbi:MAG: J domain-containing protein, partial [Sphingopyxis granuli]
YARAPHYGWGGPGDGSRSADEMRALEVLGLDPDADFEATKKAWRGLAKECHPDVRPGDEEAAKRFAAGQAAFEVLKQADERKSWKPA